MDLSPDIKEYGVLLPAKLLLPLLAIALQIVPVPVGAQTYPAKPVRLILPFPPGGGTDTMGRTIAQTLSMQARFGQRVIPDNRPGAGGNLGLEIAAKSAPDGYTMVLSSPLIAISPYLYAKLNYDPGKDLAPVTHLGFSRKVLVVHPTVPARTVKELIVLARKSPGKLNFGSGGIGSSNHLTTLLMVSLTGIKVTHVPYKGASAALVSLLGGEVDAVVSSMAGVVPLIRAGRIRPLAVLSETRGSALAEVPTCAEAGFPDFADDTWYGMFVPAGTPREIINHLNQELREALSNHELKKQLEAAGIETRSSSPEELGGFVKKENARFASVIERAGIKPN
jgi:tripartite-type tricarboxylate transporter receptor subunit TctC